MKSETETSSLNLLLTISAVVLVGLGITWWGFDYFREQEQQPPTSIVAVVAEPEVVSEVAVEAVTSDSFDTHLDKAQLAIESNMVFEPAGHNALYFIGLVLGETPDHPEANIALDSITESLTNSVRQAIQDEEFAHAHKIARMMGELRPNHPLVFEVSEAMQQHTDGLFAEAWAQAENGERNNALALIAEAGNLPGADADRVLAMQTDVDARQLEIEAAAEEQQRRSREETLAANALSDWQSKADAALAEGRFTEPAEDSAVFYLAEIDDNDAEAIAYKERLQNAVMAAADVSIREVRLDDAENLLATAAEVDVTEDRIAESRLAFDRAYANNEATKIIATQQLVWKERVAPVYPRSAERRGLQGEVEIEFIVTTSGETADVVVVSSNPDKVFDRAAIQAVQQWEFEPHTIRGVTVNQRSGAVLRFTTN